MLNSDDVREYKILVDETIKLTENICPAYNKENLSIVSERKHLICKRFASWLPRDVYHACILPSRIKIFENSLLCNIPRTEIFIVS